MSVEMIGVLVHTLLFRNVGNLVHPTLPASFGCDAKSRRFLLPSVYGYTREVKDPTHKVKSVTCRGLTQLHGETPAR